MKKWLILLLILTPTLSLADAVRLGGIPSRAQMGVDNVDNTSDANKPVSAAQAIAINAKAGLASDNTFTGKNTFADIVAKGPWLDIRAYPDTTIGVQAAIDATPTGGTLLVTRFGTYGALTLKPGITIMGQNPVLQTDGSTPPNGWKYSGTTGDFVSLNASGSSGGVKGVHIINMVIDGNGTTGKVLNMGTFWGIVERSVVQNGAVGINYATTTTFGGENRVEGSTIANCTTAGIYGTGAQSSDGFILNNIFRNNGEAVHLEMVAGWLTAGNHIYGSAAHNIHTVGYSPRIVNNYMDYVNDGTSGIYHEQNSSISGGIISGNQVTLEPGTSAIGIELVTTSTGKVLIDGNTVETTSAGTTTGIKTSGSATYYGDIGINTIIGCSADYSLHSGTTTSTLVNTSGHLYTNAYDLNLGSNGTGIPKVKVMTGTGSPESVVDAPPGSMYLQYNSGQIYKKITASGTLTGWKELVSADAVNSTGTTIKLGYGLGSESSIIAGTGSPEGVVSANSGALFLSNSGKIYTLGYSATNPHNTGWLQMRGIYGDPSDGQVAVWNDGNFRLQWASSVPPTSHHLTHSAGGSDAIAPEDIGALAPTGSGAALGGVRTIINVKNAPYNVTGSTSTDSTTGIRAAINDAIAAHGAVYFPDQYYKTTSTINITGAVQIIADGATFYRNTDFGDTFYIAPSDPVNSSVSGVHFSGVGFQSTSGSMTSGNFLHFKSANYSGAENVKMLWGFGGINVEGGTTNFFDKINIESGSGYTSANATYYFKVGKGINVNTTTATGLYLSNFEFAGNGGYVQNGIVVNGCDGFYLTTGHVNSTYNNDLLFDPLSNAAVMTVRSTGVYYDGDNATNSNGVNVQGSTSGSYGDILFNGGSIMGQNVNTGSGVVINSTSVRNVKLSGTAISGWNRHGVDYQAGSGISINGCTISHNNRSGGSYNGMNVGNGLTGFSITGNNIGTAANNGTASQSTGLYIGTGCTDFAASPNGYGSENATDFYSGSTAQNLKLLGAVEFPDGTTQSTAGASGGSLTDPGTNGVMKRTALNTTAAAASTDIVALFGSGSCSGFLKSDGTCASGTGSVTGVSSADGNISVSQASPAPVLTLAPAPALQGLTATLPTTTASTLTLAGVLSGGTLTADTHYYYKVVAVFGVVEGPMSNEIDALTTSTNKTVSLSWTAVTNASGYAVYRTTTSGDYSAAYRVTSGGTTAQDNGSNFVAQAQLSNQQFVSVAYGKVGIGTSSPAASLELYAANSVSVRVRDETSSASAGGRLDLYHNNAAGGLPKSGDRLGGIFTGSLNGSTQLNGGLIRGLATADWTASSIPTAIAFDTAPSGSTSRTERFRIGEGGLLTEGLVAATASATVTNSVTKITLATGTATITLPATLPAGSTSASMVVLGAAASGVSIAAGSGGSVTWGDAGAPTFTNSKRQRVTCVSDNTAATTTAAWDCYLAGGTF